MTEGTKLEDYAGQRITSLEKVMKTVIPWDFWFPDLKYSGTSDPLVHVESFNDMTWVQGLTQAQRYRVFLLTLYRCAGVVLKTAYRKYQELRVDV